MPTAEELRSNPKYSEYYKLLDLSRSGADVGRNIQNKVENLKEHVQFLGSIPTPEARVEEEQARALRNELIMVRNKAGYRPPTPIVPESRPDQYGYTQANRTLSFGGQTYNDVEGYTMDASGNLSGVIQGTTEKRITEPGTGRLRSVQTKDFYQDIENNRTVDLRPLQEIRVYMMPKAAPPNVEKAGSFVDTINANFEGRQVLIAEKQGDTYSVKYNPALSKSGFVDELAAQKLSELGFVEEGDTFRYYQPETSSSFGTIDTRPQGFQTQFDYVDQPTPIAFSVGGSGIEVENQSQYLGEYVQKLKAKGRGVPAEVMLAPWDIGNIPETLNIVDTPLTQFFNTDYAGDLAREVGKYDPYALKTPVGDISLGSMVVGFVGGAIETPIKSIVAVENLVVRGGQAYIAQKSGKPLSLETREAIGSDILASGSYLEYAPINIAAALGTVGELARAPTPSPAPTRSGLSKLLTVTKQESGNIVEDYGFYQLNRVPGGTGYLEASLRAGIDPIIQAGRSGLRVASPIINIGRRAAQGAITFGSFEAGIEAVAGAAKANNFGGAIEALKTPEVQGRIKAAALTGGVLFAALGTAEAAKPFFDAKAAQVRGTFSLPGQAFRAGGNTLVATMENVRLGYFLAGSDKELVRGLSQEVPGITPTMGQKMVVQMTVRNANPFVMVKAPRVNTNIIPQTQLRSERSTPFTALVARGGGGVRVRDRGREFAPSILQGPSLRGTANQITKVPSTGDFPKVISGPAVDVTPRSGPKIEEMFGINVKTTDLTKQGQTERERNPQRERQRQIEEERLIFGFAEVPRLNTPTRQLIRFPEVPRVPEKPPPELPPTTIPLPNFLSDDRGNPLARREKALAKLAQYTPSLLGVEIGKVQKRTGGSFSGLEIRGIFGRAKRRRKR
jgi:hypothetical protein